MMNEEYLCKRFRCIELFGDLDNRERPFERQKSKMGEKGCLADEKVKQEGEKADFEEKIR